MSYDTYIFLDEKTFPLPQWQEIRDAFRMVERKHNEWYLNTPYNTVWVEVEELRRTHIYSDEFKWEIHFGTNSGKSPMNYWLLLAIPFYCLLLFNDVVFYDPRYDKRIVDIDEFEEFANSYMLGFKSLQQLHKAGLLDNGEKLILFL